MKKQGKALVIISAIVGALIIGGVVAYFMTDGFGTQKSNGTNGSSEQNQTQSSQQTDKPTTGFEALLASAKTGKFDVKCTYEQNGDKGTFYVRGENTMRFDAVSSEGTSHAIKTDNTLYVWSGSESTGMMFVDTDTSSADNEADYSIDKYEDDSAAYNLHCENVGKLNNSLFTPPNNIEFIDPTTFMQQ